MAHGDPTTQDDGPAIAARIEKGVSKIDAAEWDALNIASGDNPFTSHAFLSALEDSGSVGKGTGWQSAPITIRDDNDRLVGAMPAYLKGHSQGEYVFDHSWAHAYENAGGRYYPKLQISAPFTPATGPRLLVLEEQWKTPLILAAQQLTEQNGLSSAHATFLTESDRQDFGDLGWLLRSDTQFHWANQGFDDFDGFLATLSSRKRKTIRKERRTAQSDVEIVHLSGDNLTEAHWDAFWVFYQDTGARKYGMPYLTREAFSLFGERMADRIVLVLAYLHGEPVAGALNFAGPDTLYGRYWGCTRDINCLHFELCYYQAIDIAIARGLSQVEAGAQGGHKLARGYAPVTTWSAHYIPDLGFRRAIADFLEREREAVAHDQEFLAEMTPFKKGG
ncbi:GNAT family N-acetyltransferase [Alterisphingorhabdus coralli]|uniref:GNAT family N-acetyltransferase n=1 Tax=Alterisphingorhabdus coralli TaxID=3071408 RepID=A0AA97F9Z1_9SPHN|nr:GNAT family N-acetyltransferase [Parasphingorhabdus sp. SCSIO 66989]WOE75220.1 GNAT family N-acetyltransferase [Parasphingorhabdus sp. SCSIO 66989]